MRCLVLRDHHVHHALRLPALLGFLQILDEKSEKIYSLILRGKYDCPGSMHFRAGLGLNFEGGEDSDWEDADLRLFEANHRTTGAGRPLDCEAFAEFQREFEPEMLKTAGAISSTGYPRGKTDSSRP